VCTARPDAVVIAADTVVVAGGVMLGKPATPHEAEAMLRQLSGRAHHVTTGVVVGYSKAGITLADDVTTMVQFRALRPEEIHRYVATGEPMDKAGAYGIQGRAALFVDRLEGDYFAVVGLPLARLARMLDVVGVPTS
jgi:septum formation protein